MSELNVMPASDVSHTKFINSGGVVGLKRPDLRELPL